MDVTGDGCKAQSCKEQHYKGTWNVRSMNQGKLGIVKQVMARVNINILGISELKWTEMGEFNSDEHTIISTTMGMKIMASGPIALWEIDGETVETVSDFIFWAPKSLQMVTAGMKLKDTPWKKSYDQPIWHIQKQRHYFANKGLYSQNFGFPVVMYGCESWTIKKAR